MSMQGEEKKKTKQSVFRPPILKAMKQSMKNRTRRHFALALAGIVVFTTTYSLILPALTLENNTASKMAGLKTGAVQAELLDCHVDVHQHTDDCYKMMDGEKTLICGQADYVLHTHDENCYDNDGNLVCTLPEITSTGTAENTESAANSQSANTATAEDADSLNEENRNLELHSHTVDCYEKGPNGESPEEMGWVTVNEDGSITGDPEHLICGRLEIKEHQHTADCFTQAEQKSEADANVSETEKTKKKRILLIGRKKADRQL